MLDPLTFLEFHSLGMDCFGHPLFVYGKGGGPARNGVQEEGLQILHVYSGTFGLYLRFVTPYVIRKPLGGRSEKYKKNVSGTFYNRDISSHLFIFCFYKPFFIKNTI